MYLHDIFYDHKHLTKEQKIELMQEAKPLVFEWWVDILDCKVSFHRQRIEMSFEEIMDKFTDKCHFVFIHRRGHIYDNDYIETGFCTFGQPEYFLWLHVEIDKLSYFVEKYRLKMMV